MEPGCHDGEQRRRPRRPNTVKFSKERISGFDQIYFIIHWIIYHPIFHFTDQLRCSLGNTCEHDCPQNQDDPGFWGQDMILPSANTKIQWGWKPLFGSQNVDMSPEEIWIYITITFIIYDYFINESINLWVYKCQHRLSSPAASNDYFHYKRLVFHQQIENRETPETEQERFS